MQRAKGLAALLVLFLLIAFAAPRPTGIEPAGWRLFALFVTSVAGLVFQPIPGAALVLAAVVFSSLIGGLTLKQALDGYSDPTNWLVLAAFFISRAMINTGLARRISLFFVRVFGATSLGVSYALCFSDLALAGIIPSNGARSGGVILPIARGIAELYGSNPGATARRVGAFLMASVYQGICVTSAMMFTGQASNPLAARLALETAGQRIDWWAWFRAGIVPGLASLALVPLLIHRLFPPEVTRTPEASSFAGEELRKMGRFHAREWILGAVFLSVCLGWATTQFHGLDVAVPALLGCLVLFATGVLSWEDAKKETGAWDMFIYYGGLINLAKALNATGIPKAFANAVGASLSGLEWFPLLMGALLVYFFAHYAFASITAHMLAMYAAFIAVVVAQGAPAGLAAYAFALFTNLSAGLTNYGTTPAPMFFAQDYVDMKDWWRLGFFCALLNLAIWCSLGFGWWKLIGIW